MNSQIAVGETAHATEFVLMCGEFVNFSLIACIADTLALVKEQAHVGVEWGYTVILQGYDFLLRGIENAVFVALRNNIISVAEHTDMFVRRMNHPFGHLGTGGSKCEKRNYEKYLSHLYIINYKLLICLMVSSIFLLNTKS